MLSSITISNDAAKRLEAGEMWFGVRDVVGRRQKIAGIAYLLDKRKRSLGLAFVSPGSRYYLRLFSRKRENVDKEYWRSKIRRAYERRSEIAKLTNAFRVVHAESDGIPGVVIDKYNDIWSLQITCGGAETIKDHLIDIIVDDYNPSSIIEKNDLEARKLEDLPFVEKVVYGGKTLTIADEGKEQFEIDVLHGQKTGAYLDYRNFRLKAREFAKGVCLDAFCYQGWFSCQIAEIADRVIAIDSSRAAIDAAKKNARLNGHNNIEFVKSDVFKYLKNCDERFDFIHLDPPSFAKGYSQLRSAVSGYKNLINAALKLLNPGGIFFTSACSHNITERVLERTLLECVSGAGLGCDVVFRGIQDRDHPVLRGHSESLYLKALAVKCNPRRNVLSAQVS